MSDVTELRATLKLNDGDLMHGDSLLLHAAKRISELKALVEASYREGFWDGYDDDARPQDADAGWEHSDVRKRMEPPR